MQHRFFQKSEKEQKLFLLNVGLTIFLLTAAILFISYFSGFYLLAGLIPILFLIAAPFIDLPMGKKKGTFIYHSPLFITEKPRDNKITIHGGTLFDYLFTIEKDMDAKTRTRIVFLSYINGLLNFISKYEQEDHEDLILRGTSYIVNDRTAKLFGFRPVSTDAGQLLILFFNYIPLTISNTFVKKRLTFPHFSEVNTYEAKLSEVIKQKAKLQQLKARLEK
jgi:hypothetical protein